MLLGLVSGHFLKYVQTDNSHGLLQIHLHICRFTHAQRTPRSAGNFYISFTIKYLYQYIVFISVHKHQSKPSTLDLPMAQIISWLINSFFYLETNSLLPSLLLKINGLTVEVEDPLLVILFLFFICEISPCTIKISVHFDVSLVFVSLKNTSNLEEKTLKRVFIS